MKLANIGKLIELYGGAKAVSEELGVTISAVCQWRKANSVPHKRAEQFAGAFKLGRNMVFDPWGDSETMTAEETEKLVREKIIE